MRLQCKIQGTANAQAVFDVLAGQGRDITMSAEVRGGWVAVAFNAEAGERDWHKWLSSLFPDARISCDVLDPKPWH